MADKSIKVKIGADSKEFNDSVTKAEKEVRSFSSQLRTTAEDSAKKAIGARSYIDAIYKGLVSWGKVIKTLVFERPLESLRNYVEEVKAARESLANTSGINAGRRSELLDTVKQLKELQKLEVDGAAKRLAAQRLIKNATVLYGGKTGLSFDLRSNQISGLEQFEYDATKRAHDLAIQEKETMIKTLQEQLGGEANVLGFLQSKIWNYWTGSMQKKSAEELSKMADELQKAQADLEKLRRQDPAADVALRMRSERYQAMRTEEKARMQAMSAEQKARMQAMSAEQKARMQAMSAEQKAWESMQQKRLSAIKQYYNAQRNYQEAIGRLQKLQYDRQVARELNRLRKLVEKAGQKLAETGWYQENTDNRTKRQRKADEKIQKLQEKYGDDWNKHLGGNALKRYKEIQKEARKQKSAEKKAEKIEKRERTRSEAEEISQARLGIADAARQVQEAGNVISALATPFNTLNSTLQQIAQKPVWFVAGGTENGGGR